MKKQKLRNYFKIGILLLGLSLVLTNCSKESISEQEINIKTENATDNAETVSFEEAINHFSSNKVNNGVSSKKSKSSSPLTVEPDWNSLNQSNLPNSKALLTATKATVNRKGNYTSQLFFVKIKGEIKNVIYTVYEDSLDTDGNIINARFFINEINGTYIDGYKFENSTILKRYVIKNSTLSKTNLSGKSKNIDPPGDCWNTETLESFGGGQLPAVYITGRNNGSSGGFGGYIYVGSSRGPSTNGTGSYYSQGSTHMGSSSSSNQTKTLTAREMLKEIAGDIVVNPPATYDDDKIDNQLTGKADCVYEKLVKTIFNNHNLITETYLYFGKGNPFENNLFYKAEPNLINDKGQMLLGKFNRIGNDYIITLNKDQLDNRSSLEIATTILHESVHALLRNQYVNANDSFVSLFCEYMKEKTGSNNVTHAIMRDNYIPGIAYTLKQFDNNQENDSFYENLAWEGLHQFLSQEAKDKILDDIQKARNKGLKCN